MRLFSKIPILILSVRGEEKDVFKGLELGADDYVIKPFRQLELLARIKSLVRRRAGYEPEQTIVCGEFQLKPAEHTINYKGKSIHLTNTECVILAELMLNSGRTVTPDKISEELWGNNFVNAASSLKVYIRRLRQKLEPNPGHPIFIITKQGIGYLFNTPV